MMTDHPHYTHDTVTCAELDRLAGLEPEPPMSDYIDVLIWRARRAEIHAAMLVKMREDEEKQRGEQEQRR